MATPAATLLTCTQCGGELHPDEGQVFLTCPFCGATVYLDRSRVVFHWYVAPTIDQQKAIGELYRWMSGSQTVKDLDKKAQVTGQAFRYFPLWYFRLRTGEGQQEEIGLQPAAATSVTELSHLNLPAGDLRPYITDLDSQADPPTVPLETGLEWFRQKNPKAEVLEMAVVHVPIFIYKYSYKGQTYTAVVEAASGAVLANLYPAKAEAPYLLVGGVAAAVYLALALIPVVGAGVDSSGGLMVSLALCGGLGLLAAPILLAWAAWVASRV